MTLLDARKQVAIADYNRIMEEREANYNTINFKVCSLYK